MKRSSRLTPRPFKLAMSLALGCTPATRSEAMKLGERLVLAVPGSFLEAFTPRSFRMKLTNVGGAHAVVRGDGDLVWSRVIQDCANSQPERVYEGGRVGGDEFLPARWDLLPRERYMWASVQTVRGCPKHCSFCSVWRTDGQEPRQRGVEAVIREVVELRRLGFRFIALADDNFYPVTLADLETAARKTDPHRLHELQALRQERFDLMGQLARLPNDLIFFTQITMEAAEDPEFLDAMRRAHIRGALVGVESVTPEGLKDVYKGFNYAGEALVERLQAFKQSADSCARIVHLRPA